MTQYNINEKNQPVDAIGNVVTLTSFPHFNGVNWFEFETESERTEYIEANAPAPVWDKDAHCELINTQHNQLVESILIDHNYLSIGELSLWLDDATYGTEAQAILDWWRSTCEAVETYCDTVTEITEDDNFVSNLQLPNIGENTNYSWVTEKPIGTINGANKSFTTSVEFNPAILDVWINGILQEKSSDYEVVNNSGIEFTEAPPVGAKIVVSFKKL